MAVQKIFGRLFRKSNENTVAPADAPSLPKSIYRYKAINNYLLDTFIEKRFFLPRFEQLNDPCEGFYNVEFVWNEVNIRAGYRSMMNYDSDKDTIGIIEGHHGTDAVKALQEIKAQGEDRYVAHLRNFFNGVGNRRNHEFKQSQRKIDLYNIRILSFSDHPNSAAMCASYAENNEGVCLEFSTKNAPFDALLPVSYSEDPPKWNPFGTEKEAMIARMLTKDTSWSQEREWRYIGHSRNGDHIAFNMEDLLSVTFCEKAKQEKMHELLDCLAKSGWRGKEEGKVFQFQPDPQRSKYGFDRKSLSI